MKFISKNSNLRIILKPGIPAQPVLGIPAVGSVSVKFQDGMAEIKDQKIIDKMLTHTGYGSDFIAVDENGNDPYSYNRTEAEPGHIITEIKYGHAERSTGTPQKIKLSPEMQAVIAEMANEMANKRIKEMLPSLLSETLEGMAQVSALKQNIASQDGVIASVEGDSSRLDEDNVTTPTQKDFEEAEEVELDDEEIIETLNTAKIQAPIEIEQPKKRAGRPSVKK